MSVRFAYSYDRDNDFTGSYESPEAAFDAAVKESEGVSSPPTTIYIGQILPGDPQVDDHAEQLLASMNQRAHVDFGHAAEKYLRKVSAAQLAELDEAVAAVLLAWLQKNKLMPKFQRVVKVREYPVVTPPSRIPPDKKNEKEITEIGTGRYEP